VGAAGWFRINRFERGDLNNLHSWTRAEQFARSSHPQAIRRAYGIVPIMRL
jgi:hypothetical protein